jgi:hypothetical protein
MIEYNFISFDSLKKIFLKNEDIDCYGVCTIADLLSITEYHKKTKPIFNINEVFKAFNKSNIVVATLSHDQLKESLFVGELCNYNFITEVSSTSKSPKYSLAYLSMTESNNNWWWSEEIWNEFIEMYEREISEY